jgi:N-acetylglucosamine kinase-like BadF-type ATPase
MDRRYYIGIDGGGTRTTIALADDAGVELARRSGPAGIVDPRRPLAAADTIVRLVRELLGEATVTVPVEALCAGLAGTGNAVEREAVREALEREGVARRVAVCSDGEIALEGALGGRPGVLLVGGTGSVGWGRGEDGQIQRCGGWGMIAGDEGSAYGLGRAALAAALRSHDGRGEETLLLPRLLEVLDLAHPDALPSWAGRAEKGEIAGLALHVIRLAQEGDGVAGELVREAAGELAEHAMALIRRLGPWRSATPVVLHGGLARHPAFATMVEAFLRRAAVRFEMESAAKDAAAGAVELARGLRGAPPPSEFS